MSNTTVFVDGSAYSPADPYATALVFSGSDVEWVGSDAGANSIYDDSMSKVQLDGDLLTPAFVLGGIYLESISELDILANRLKANGYSAASIFISPTIDIADLAELNDSEFKFFLYARTSNISEIESLTSDIHGIQIPSGVENIDPLLKAALNSGKKVSFIGTDAEYVSAVCEVLQRYSALERAKLSPRLDGIKKLSSHLAEKAKSLSIALGFSSHLQDDVSLTQAVSTGAIVFLGSDPLEPSEYLGWELALHCVVRENVTTQISARATFNALTRGVYRALGESNPMFGQLAPQSPADIARWKVTELMVQTANDTVAAWSTDPRARIPLLPVLEENKLPELVELVISGKLQAK